MQPPAGDVTVLLGKIRAGDQEALAALMPVVYQELRRLAGHFMREERPGHTLQPTALVHEAYLCLAGQDRANWQNRAQFMAIAAQMMRRILLQYARRRGALKRAMPEPEKPGLRPGAEQWEEILAVDAALTRLSKLSGAAGAHRRNAIFRRLVCGGSRRGAEHFSPNREARLGRGQRLAARGTLGSAAGMTAERWDQITSVFRAAVEKPDRERCAFLDEACGSDDPLRRNVERLLAAEAEPSLASPTPEFLEAGALELRPGDSLAQYRVEAKLGEGGMGAVYRGYDSKLQRKVALKVLSCWALRRPGRQTQAVARGPRRVRLEPSEHRDRVRNRLPTATWISSPWSAWKAKRLDELIPP